MLSLSEIADLSSTFLEGTKPNVHALPPYTALAAVPFLPMVFVKPLLSTEVFVCPWCLISPPSCQFPSSIVVIIAPLVCFLVLGLLG